MNLTCAACPHCLNTMDVDPGDPCPYHRESEVYTTPHGHCDHHNTQGPVPLPARNRAERRANARAGRRTP